ncbi:MAG: hypothetical protein EXQ52_00405 [Bryobacterales bacterium]|nr:hypothetical protein [Bryobacterales bacterium]
MTEVGVWPVTTTIDEHRYEDTDGSGSTYPVNKGVSILFKWQSEMRGTMGTGAAKTGAGTWIVHRTPRKFHKP